MCRYIIKSVYFSFGLGLFLNLSSSIAQAQLSQLDFDSGQKEKKRALIAENADLWAEMTGEEQNSKSALRKKTKIEEGAGTRAALSNTIDASLSEDKTWLIPAIGSLETDSKSAHSITGEYSWEHKVGASCGEPKNEAEKFLKARSLESLVKKLTGSDNFTKSQCSNTCESGIRPVMSRLKIVDMKGGSFKFIKTDEGCAYQMTKPSDKSWEIVEVKETTCSCY